MVRTQRQTAMKSGSRTRRRRARMLGVFGCRPESCGDWPDLWMQLGSPVRLWTTTHQPAVWNANDVLPARLLHYGG
jgi:hypothetical protein